MNAIKSKLTVYIEECCKSKLVYNFCGKTDDGCYRVFTRWKKSSNLFLFVSDLFIVSYSYFLYIHINLHEVKDLTFQFYCRINPSMFFFRFSFSVHLFVLISLIRTKNISPTLSNLIRCITPKTLKSTGKTVKRLNKMQWPTVSQYVTSLVWKNWQYILPISHT